MANGIKRLKEIARISGETTKVFSYNNTKITQHALNRGIKLYHKAIMKFIGNSIITRIKKASVNSIDDLRKCFETQATYGKGEWIDLAGLIAPKQSIIDLLHQIENQTIESLDKIDHFFKMLHTNYYDYEWNWTNEFIADYLGQAINLKSVDEVIAIIQEWLSSVVEIDQMIYQDARKEFRLESMTGFGIDGDQQTKETDFKNVRGSFEENSFVKEILNHIQRKTDLGKAIIKQLEDLNPIDPAKENYI